MGAPAELERARAYDAWYETPLGTAAHRIELRLVAELAASKRGERALDVGCGTGIYAAWLAEQGLEVTGLDRDPAMLAAAQAKAPGRAVPRRRRDCAPLRRRPVRPRRRRHPVLLPRRRATARSSPGAVRVVRPGGRVVVGELARFSLWSAQRRVKGWRGSPTWRSVHFTSGGELEAIERAGRLLRALGAAFVVVRAEVA